MRGLVVCPQPQAANVGAAILERGGNAFDAAVATAFVQMVVDPFMCGIGGMGTLQYFNSQESLHGMIDFHSRAGEKVSPTMWEQDLIGRSEVNGYSMFADFRSELGYSSIMTPGAVSGFWETHKKLCSWDWQDLLEPAIDIAKNGFSIDQHVYDFWTRPTPAGIPSGAERVRATEACSKIYLKKNKAFPAVGEIISNTDMSKTLHTIAKEGSAVFYKGEIAERIVEDFQSNNAFVTFSDLENYKTSFTKPIIGYYRDYKIASNPPPGSGAILIQMLQTLEHFDLKKLGHNTGDAMNIIASTMKLSHHDRDQHLADPLFNEVNTDLLISPEKAAKHANLIKNRERLPSPPAIAPSCTTHLCTLDEKGNTVSATHTLGTGSGVVTPGLGFVYNNSMKLADAISGRPNSIAPGKARTTGMVPTILFKNDEPFMILGALGGSVIISAVLQTILNIVDFGMSPMEAVSVPRIHSEGDFVHVEARVESSQIAVLESFGHKIKKSPYSFDPMMARCHVILKDKKSWKAGADPRSGGGVAFARV